ncbi:MAG: ABC transporter permease [Roseiflexaceae bacterium]
MIDFSTANKAAPTSERSTWGKRLLSMHTWMVYIFLYAPIMVLVLFSFTQDAFGVRWTGFTLKWYARLFADERMMNAALNTLWVALIATIISTVFGTLMALAMERYRFKGRAGLDALLYLPIVIPEIVMALALLAFFSFSFGLIDQLFGIKFRMNIWTVIFSHVAFCLSFVVVVVRASLKGFDIRLEEAASDLGADARTTFWRVTLPLIMPGVIGGALLAFTLSLDDFIISFFTVGPGTNLLPVEVYGRVKRAVTPQINAISTIMLIISMLLVFLSQFVQRRRD